MLSLSNLHCISTTSPPFLSTPLQTKTLHKPLTTLEIHPPHIPFLSTAFTHSRGLMHAGADVLLPRCVHNAVFACVNVGCVSESQRKEKWKSFDIWLWLRPQTERYNTWRNKSGNILMVILTTTFLNWQTLVLIYRMASKIRFYFQNNEL